MIERKKQQRMIHGRTVHNIPSPFFLQEALISARNQVGCLIGNGGTSLIRQYATTDALALQLDP